MSNEDTPHRAIERRSRWPGWIWSIPIAAAAIVIWLVIRDWSSAGPKVTVIFPGVADLKRNNTKVKFRGMTVGTVESVHLSKDLTHTRVVLELKPELKEHLGKGTKFWIVGETLSLANISAFKTLVSGPYVSIKPSPGHWHHPFTGLTRAPVLNFGERGTPFVLHSSTADGVEHGTPIYYLDQKAGEVRDYRMTGYHSFDITIMIKSPFDKLVHVGTRFWNAGAIHLATGASGPKLEFRSIPALVQGAIAFETPPNGLQGPVSKPYGRFQLYSDRQQAENAPDYSGVTYQVVFRDVSQTLKKYAPVKLMGTRVGSVDQSRFEYSPQTGKLTLKATIVIEPARIPLANGASWSANARPQMDQMMSRLIAQGLRAELSSSPPIIGGQMVVLQIEPGRTGKLIPGQVPAIPTVAGSNIQSIIQRANSIEDKINRMPLTRIADRIDRSAANLDRVTAEARDQLPAALKSARESLAEAQMTLASAQGLLSANGTSSNQPYSTDVPKALYEMTRAARSLRELSDFIDRHPEALIEGRGASQ
jgi:paraquat-inducible protein B